MEKRPNPNAVKSNTPQLGEKGGNVTRHHAYCFWRAAAFLREAGDQEGAERVLGLIRRFRPHPRPKTVEAEHDAEISIRRFWGGMDLAANVRAVAR